ncbi:MAG: hypothetical protein AABZ60_24205 [Planctomycetota bacterium]
MRYFIFGALISLFFGGFFSFLGADQILILKDGQVLKGEILQISLEKVIIQIDQARITLPVDRLSSLSLGFLYQEHLRSTNTFGEIVELADFCERFDLIAQALECFKKAQILQELTEEQTNFLKENIERLRLEDAKRRFQKALELYEKKEFEEAKIKLLYVQKNYEDTLYGAEAKKVIAQINEDLKLWKEEQKKKAEDAKKQEKKLSKEELLFQKKLEEATQALGVADQKNVEGLQYQSQIQYQKGVKAYEAAESLLDFAEEVANALQQKAQNPETQNQAKLLLDQIPDKRLNIYLNFAHLWAVSLNFNKATLYVNRILAMNPDHEEAKRLRLKITEEQIRRNK